MKNDANETAGKTIKTIRNSKILKYSRSSVTLELVSITVRIEQIIKTQLKILFE